MINKLFEECESIIADRGADYGEAYGAVAILKGQRMLKVATAFTGGLSAIDFALKYENLKYTHLMACEIDKYARKQFLEFHGEPLEFPSDVSLACGKHLKGKVDLYCFGSPCQDLSLAGKRLGFDGQKSSLFRHGARVLEEMKPKAFIFENVKGLLSSNGGADYKEVIKTFQDMGYLIAMKVMNTKDYGVPQNRERVFIVGFLDADDYHSFSFEDGFELEIRLKHYLDESVDEKYYLSENTISVVEKIINKGKGYARFITKYEKYLKTFTARMYASFGADFIIDEIGIRKLTPRECFRLQGVRDSCIDLVVSDSQAYKIAGNAISVNVMQSLLRSLYKPAPKKGTLF